MSSLISNCEKEYTNKVFEDVFDTFSRNIIVYKEPLKTQVISPDSNAIFGFGQSQQNDIFTYTPITGVFPAMIKYQSRFGSKVGYDLFEGEINTYISDAPVSIKVRQDCSDFILTNKTERIEVDGLPYIMKEAAPNPQIFWNTVYMIYDLERKL
jgi:hypothetical protein